MGWFGNRNSSYDAWVKRLQKCENDGVVTEEVIAAARSLGDCGDKRALPILNSLAVRLMGTPLTDLASPLQTSMQLYDTIMEAVGKLKK